MSENTAKITDPIWDSRNSDEPAFVPTAGSATAMDDALIIAFVQGAQYWENLRTGATMWGEDRNRMEAAALDRLAKGTLGKSPNEKLCRPADSEGGQRKEQPK